MRYEIRWTKGIQCMYDIVGLCIAHVGYTETEPSAGPDQVAPEEIRQISGNMAVKSRLVDSLCSRNIDLFVVNERGSVFSEQLETSGYSCQKTDRRDQYQDTNRCNIDTNCKQSLRSKQVSVKSIEDINYYVFTRKKIAAYSLVTCYNRGLQLFAIT